MIRDAIRVKLSRWITLPIAGVASVVASIVVPSVVISGYALFVRDAMRVTHFALMVAEPLAFVGALVTTAMVARRTSRDRSARWGAVIGVAASAAMLGAAIWVHDVDAWTAAAVVLLPVAGMVGMHVPLKGRAMLAVTETGEAALLASPPMARVDHVHERVEGSR